jgi:hypothetical protein
MMTNNDGIAGAAWAFRSMRSTTIDDGRGEANRSEAPTAEDAADAVNAGLPVPPSALERELLRTETYTDRLVRAEQGVVRVLETHGTAVELACAQADLKLAADQLNGVLRHLPVPEKLPPLSLEMLGPVAGPIVAPHIAPIAASFAAGVAAGAAKTESDAEFWGRISDLIGLLKTGYLGVFETAMEKNNDFHKDFTAIYSRMPEWQKGDDKNTILKLEGTKKVPVSDSAMAKLMAETRAEVEAFNEKMSQIGGVVWPPLPTDDASIHAIIVKKGQDTEEVSDGLLSALKELLLVYRNGPSTVFVSDRDNYYWTDEDEKAGRGKSGEKITDVNEISARNKAIAEKWATDTGLPRNGVLKSVNDGITWLVKLDFAPVQNMIDGLEALKKQIPLDADGNITMSASKFQSWRAGFDDQANAIKDTSSVMAKKLVNAQSVYENLIKVLSATIAAMLETCKLCVQN